MRFFKFNRIFPVMLLAAVLSAGILSFMSMSHSVQRHETCVPAIAQGACTSVPQGNEACLDNHLSILNKLSQAVPSGGKLALLALVLLPIFAWFIDRLPLLFRYFLHIRVRMRWLWEDLVYSFSKLFWFLALQEKRDPSFAFL